jgi:dolichol-phosphate mannosyltransferase
MKVFFPIRGVREYSCGFRAYRAGVIQEAIAFWGNNFIQLKGLGFTGTLEKLVKLNMLGARFGEVPFVLRYDRKVSPSKMVGSITTLGYLIMTILYYWPWGGWRSTFHRTQRAVSVSSDVR